MWGEIIIKHPEDNGLVRSLHTELLYFISEQFLICSKSGPPLPLHLQPPSFLTSEASLSHKGETGLYLPAYLLWQSAPRLCPSLLSHSPRNDVAHSLSYFPTFLILSTCSIQIAQDTTLLPMNQSCVTWEGPQSLRKPGTREAFLRMPLNTVLLAIDTMLYGRSPELIVQEERAYVKCFYQILIMIIIMIKIMGQKKY